MALDRSVPARDAGSGDPSGHWHETAPPRSVDARAPATVWRGLVVALVLAAVLGSSGHVPAAVGVVLAGTAAGQMTALAWSPWLRGLDLVERAVATGLLPAGSDFDDRTTAVALRTGTPAGRVDLEGTRRDTDRFGHRSTEHTVTAGFAPPPLQGAQLAFSATWNQLRAGPTRVRALSGLVSLMTAPATWLRVQAGVEAYDWRQSGLEDQRFLSGRVGADATVGQLELSLAAEAHRREFVVTNLTRRVTLRVLRRF